MTASNLDKVYGALKEANRKSKRPGKWSSVAEVADQAKGATGVNTALEILHKQGKAIKHKERLLYKVSSGFAGMGSSSDSGDRRTHRGDRSGRDNSDRNRDLATGAVVGAVAVGGLGRIAGAIR